MHMGTDAHGRAVGARARVQPCACIHYGARARGRRGGPRAPAAAARSVRSVVQQV